MTSFQNKSVTSLCLLPLCSSSYYYYISLPSSQFSVFSRSAQGMKLTEGEGVEVKLLGETDL
jgi:hypothetical protein